MDLLLESENNSAPAGPSSNTYQPTYAPPPGPPPPLTVGKEGALPVYTEEDAAVLFETPSTPPDRASLEPLPLPVAVPQVRVSYDAPFVRAWNDDLVRSGVQQEEWLTFIDGLNIAMTASPPLRVIDAAGMIIGFIPYHWTIIASALIQAGAQTAARTISKTLTDRYLRRANTTYFEPRGLKVRLMKTAAVRQFLQLKQSGEGGQVKGKGKMRAFGQSAGRYAEAIGMHLPIARRIIPMFQKPPAKIPTDAELAALRMAQFSATTPPLALTMSTLALPAPRQPKGLMDKGSALAIKLDIWRANKREAKDKRARQLLDVAQGRAPPESLDEQFWKEAGSGIAGTGIGSKREARRAREVVDSVTGDPGSLRGRIAYVRRNGPIASALASVGVERKDRRTRELEAKVHKADRMEMLKNEELVWVVLLNEEDDKLIQGTDLVDTDAPEQIDDAELREIIDEENAQDEEDAIELVELEKAPAYSEGEQQQPPAEKSQR